MAELPKKILFVDSDSSTASTLSSGLEKQQVELISASDLETAKYRFNSELFKVVMVDIKLQEVEGLALIQQWRLHEMEDKRNAGFILMASGALTAGQQALANEMKDILIVQKPVSYPQILSHLQKAFNGHHNVAIRKKAKAKLLNKLTVTGSLDLAIAEAKGQAEVLGTEYVPVLVDLYTQAKNYDAALHLVENASDQILNPLQKTNLSGKLYLLKGDTEKAKELLEKADELAPKNMDRVTEMVDLYLTCKEPDKAVGKQKELLAMRPEEPEYKFSMFKKLDENGYGAHAAEFCRETTGPKEVVRYFNNKGVLLAKTNSSEEALEEYRRALSYYPKNKDNHLIHFNMALAHYRSGTNLEEAEKHLTSALDLKPDYDKAKSLLEKVQQGLISRRNAS